MPVLAGLLVHLCACSGPPLEVSDVYATQSPANALAYYVEWTTSEPAASQLTVDCGPDYRHQFDDPGPSTDHRVFVMGLWDGASCQLAIAANTDSKKAAPYTEMFEVGPLPAYLPEITVETPDDGNAQPGWTLVNLSNGFVNEPLNIAMIDNKGRYRWYNELNTSFQGADTDTRVVAEGVLVGGTNQLVHPTIVDWQGNAVWTAPFGMHHDLRPDLGGEDQLLYLAGATDCPSGFPSSTVNLWDRATTSTTWEWKMCDHYPAGVQGDDWDHLNAAVPVPGGDSLLLSSRNLDRLIEIDRASGDILWELGPNLGWTLTGDGWFYHQHAPELEPNGNILLFDNGVAGIRESSRAVEISFDVATKQAQIVWQFDPDPPIFAEIWGDADRLANGNTLVTFGRRGDTEDTHLIEASPAGTEVWHVSFAQGWGSYRAERVVDPPVGELLSE